MKMRNYSKGQITIEFILSILLFIIILTTLLLLVVDYVPELESNNERAKVNMEARRLTSMLLTSSGMNETGDSEWESNPNTVEDIGLASRYHVVEKDKLDAMSTRSNSKFNYTQFLNVTGVKNEYRISFTVLPIIDTSNTFGKTNPPEDPNITEPTNSDYINAGNQIRYGSMLMGGNTYNFLITSHSNEYDTMYQNRDAVSGWNFTGASKYVKGDQVPMGGREFEIKSFQNKGSEKGTLVVLSRPIKTFGSTLVVDSTIVNLNRYAVLKQPGANKQPLRIEVFAWRES